MENVERVVALMAEHGIETRIANRRAYQGADWKRFSYTATNDRDAWPQVSVVRSEDQTLARKLLRDAGLEPAASRAVGDVRSHRRTSMHVKLVVLALIVGVAMLIAMTQFAH
jgi:hypothetical protein